MKKINTIAFVVFGFIASQSASAGVALIVNAEAGVDSLSENQAQKLYLGKSSRLPNGVEVEVKDLSASDDARATFYDKVVKKSDRQLKAYWSRLIFTGKGAPPTEASSTSDMIEWVANNKGAVGYVETSSIDSDKVKIVLEVK